MAGYTRQSTFADGDTITAALFNNEYNQLVNAFSNTSGHAHDGTAANGPVIGLIGDAGEITPLNKILIDTANNYIEFYVDVSSSSVQQLYIADGAIIPVTDNDIDLGTSSLEFKNLYLDGTAKIDVLTVDEAATIGTTLGVTGATTLSSTLGVTGATTLSSTLGVTGATTLSSTLAVTGTSTLTGNVTASNDLSVGGNLTVTGNATISGNLTFGDADTDSITLTADIASNIVPDVDDTYDLGTATKQWRNLYIDGTAEVDTLSIDGTAVTSTAAELNILDGVTATAAEINTLDGITATVAELNILDGVTSTATELNIMDGDTAATATTLADADRVVVNDAGVMKQVALTDFETYFESALDTLSNVTTVGALNAGSITSGFGAIDNGSSNITTTGTVTYGSLSDGTITITAFADEDDMVSNSATLVPTQQSVKAYVDSQVATANELSELTDVNLTTPADASLLFYDTTTSKWIDNVVSGDISIADTGVAAIGSGVIVNDDINASAAISVSKTALTAGTGLTLSTDTLAIDSTVATLTGTQTLTNKTLTTPIISSISNTGTLTLPTSTDTLVGRATTDTLTNKTLTSPVLNTGVSGTAVLDEDNMASNSATQLATQQSIKAYVDSQVSGVSSDSITDADGDTKIQVEESADEDIIRFDTAGTERVVIDASGDVGIGGDTTTATSLNNLSIGAYADASSGIVLRATTASALNFEDNSSVTAGRVYYNHASGYMAFNTEQTERMRIDSSGNVLVGKTSADNGATVGIEMTATDKLYVTDSASSPIIANRLSSDGNVIAVQKDGTSVGVIGTQSWGIGTTSPNSTLHVDGGGQNSALFLHSTDTDTFITISDDDGAAEIRTKDGGALQFSTGGTTNTTADSTIAMYINSSQNVGIGTTSPQKELHVVGAAIRLESQDAGASAAPTLELYRNSASPADGDDVGQINFRGEDDGGAITNYAIISAEIADVTGGTEDGRLRFFTSTAGSTTEKLRIDESGNVGIGETSPSSYGKFAVTAAGIGNHINSTSGAGGINFYEGGSGRFSLRTLNGSAGLAFYDTFNSAERMRIDSSGNVGIGTSSPATDLAIVKSTSPTLRLERSGASQLDLIASTSATGNVIDAQSGKLTVRTSTSTQIEFETNNSERMRITGGGDVLIGTTAAFSSGVFDVQGGTNNTIEAMGIKNNAGGSYNVMIKFYTSAGAVGRIDWDNTGSAMGFTNLSDARLKNVTGEAKGLELINKLNPVKYYFKDNDWESEGLIAQEVEQTFEELDMPVKGVRKPDENNEHYMLDYSVFTTNLIKAVKELSAEVDELKNEIKLLKGGN